MANKEIVVATVSPCHGAVSLLKIGATPDPEYIASPMADPTSKAILPSV
jgi:hypothetical protein